MPPGCDPLAKSTGNPDRKGIGLNLWQPYFLLMAVLGLDKKICCGCGDLDVNLLWQPAPIYQIGGGGTKYQEG